MKYIIVRCRPPSTAADSATTDGKRSQSRTFFDFDSLSVRRRAVSRAVLVNAQYTMPVVVLGPGAADRSL